MQFLLTLATLASGAVAQMVRTVNVGAGGQLVFSPDTITAEAGDTIQFVFSGGNHTVTQAAFDNPCNPIDGAFFSGFIGPTSTSFSIVLTDTDPIWFYCGQMPHCRRGMVGVINPPSSGNTLAAFRSAAAGVNTETNPSSPFGGVISVEGGAVSTAPGAVQGGDGTTTRAATTTTGGEATSTGGAETSSGGEETSTGGAVTSTGGAVTSASNSGTSSQPSPTGNSAMFLTGDIAKVAVGIFGAAALLV